MFDARRRAALDELARAREAREIEEVEKEVQSARNPTARNPKRGDDDV
jgi:hypothetical protein